MVNIETFMLGLLVVSTLTGLVTEAIKKILSERGITYYANTLAGGSRYSFIGCNWRRLCISNWSWVHCPDYCVYHHDGIHQLVMLNGRI